MFISLLKLLITPDRQFNNTNFVKRLKLRFWINVFSCCNFSNDILVILRRVPQLRWPISFYKSLGVASHSLSLIGLCSHRNDVVWWFILLWVRPLRPNNILFLSASFNDILSWLYMIQLAMHFLNFFLDSVIIKYHIVLISLRPIIARTNKWCGLIGSG